MTDEKVYQVRLTASEMQAIVNGLTRMFNMTVVYKAGAPSPQAAVLMRSALEKMKKAAEERQIVLLEDVT